MAIKTFSVGEVLTASDTNTYLANAGLTYITQTSFTNSTAVNVDGCFTTTHTNYRILVNFTAASTNTSINLRMRDAGTTNANSNYTWGGFISYSGSAILSASTSGGTATGWVVTELDTAYYPNTPTAIEIMSPKAAYRTTIFSNGFTPVNPQSYYRHIGGIMSVTTAYDGFALVPTAGNVTGTVTVYGYRIS
jgi:hypothetical protein